ncbi:MAG: patatin-like phospholipase family protein [Cyanobacteria bacterium J06626_4]
MAENRERIGLVLSGGGARGAYHAGVIHYLAESGIKIDVVSGASIGALNGALVAASVDLEMAACRLQDIWNKLADVSPSKLNINIPSFLALKLLGEVAFTLGGKPLQSCVEYLNLPPEKIGLLEQGYVGNFLKSYVSPESLKDGLPLYISVYRTAGALIDLANVLLAAINIKNTQPSDFLHIQSIASNKQLDMILASAALPLVFEAKHGFADGGMGSFIDSQGNTPAHPLVHQECCSHIIVTHLDNGSLWDRYRYKLSEAVLLEIRPKKDMQREGWKDLISFNSSSIQYWIEQGYEDAQRCLGRVGDYIALRHLAGESQREKKRALNALNMDGFEIR